MSTHAGLVVSYNYSLVALSIFIAMLAAYAALDLSGRVTSAKSLKRLAWLGGGAIAMGSGIWAMHYVGMEAFSLPCLSFTIGPLSCCHCFALSSPLAQRCLL